jgi:predicted outer membrane repeat protein
MDSQWRVTSNVRRVALALLLTMLIALLPTMGSPAHAQSTIRYVKAGAAGLTNGTSWDNAYSTLQDALADASATEIWVAKGTYYPTEPTDATDPRSATFQLVAGVAIYGGFKGDETARDQRNWRVNVVTLSGDLDQSGTQNDNDAYHVVTGASSATLDGVTITGGNANASSPHNAGGGIFNYSSSPTLSNVTISGNSATDSGGGIFNYSSSPTLSNVTISGNSATDSGGGIFNDGNSDPTLSNVTISGNSTTGSGGGMYNYYSSPTLSNVTISGNSATDSGGGIFTDKSNLTLTNVTISGNSASSGGGMFNQRVAPRLTNVTISGNSASSGGGIFNFSAGSEIHNSIIWGNGQAIFNADYWPYSGFTISHSLVEGSGGSGSWNTDFGPDGGGNLDADPRFVAAGPLAPSTGGNLRLRAGSPAINAGDNSFVPAGSTTDLDGNPRIVGGRVDMGAYEFQVTYAFSGFADPVRPNVVNVVNAGRTIPLKWRVTDASGNPISTLTSVIISSAAGGCNTGATGVSEPATAAGASGLQNLGNGYYQFNWKTSRGWAGSCRTLQLDLGDGQIHTAIFQFR